MDTIISYLLFIGSGLYLVSGLMFSAIFVRALRTRNGIGLAFLKVLSASLAIGSFTVFIIRIWSEYGNLDYLVARAIAVVNPISLVATALYLNFLSHHKRK